MRLVDVIDVVTCLAQADAVPGCHGIIVLTAGYEQFEQRLRTLQGLEHAGMVREVHQNEAHVRRYVLTVLGAGRLQVCRNVSKPQRVLVPSSESDRNKWDMFGLLTYLCASGWSCEFPPR